MLLRELEIRCDKLRDEILHRRLAGEEEVERYWPKLPEWPLPGVTPAAYLEENPDGKHAATALELTDQDPWILCLMHMGRLFGRSEWMKEGSDYASEQLLKALRDEPEEVQLTTGATVYCYPKSFDALEFCSTRGWIIGWLETRRMALEAAMDGEDRPLDPEQVPEPMSTLEAVRREIDEQQALLCWTATSEGVGLPFRGNGDRWIPAEGEEVPAEFYELHPLDVRFIVEAFRRVNYLRLHWLPQLKSRGGEGRSGWESFWSNRAKKAGKTSRYLMMAVSFASQIAEETLAARSIEDVLGD